MAVDGKTDAAVRVTMRIAKMIARSGICSRREAERLIEQGRVAVDGKVLSSPALDVSAEQRITIDGEPLPEPQPTRMWRYHKPRGQVTTHKDPQGRPTVFSNLPEVLPRLISVGRLDINTEGLLLLTNDGELARHLELPATGWLRRYRVRVFGKVSQDVLDKLNTGIEVEGVRYGPIEARLDRTQGGNAWLTVGLREGKNREVKRVMEHLGLSVNRLIRISFGPFQLGDLESGKIEEIKPAVLADQLGPRLAGQFGLSGRVGRGVQARPGSKRPAQGGRPTGGGRGAQGKRRPSVQRAQTRPGSKRRGQ